jgi:hypothetical protein
LPSGAAITFLVQWWLIPAGRSMTFVPLAVMLVSPVLYGNFHSASALAMYMSLPTSTMPKGEFRSCMNTVFVSAVPSGFRPRSRVMRLGDSTPAPAFFWAMPCTLARMPSSFGASFGLLLSATRMSPFGITYSQRG